MGMCVASVKHLLAAGADVNKASGEMESAVNCVIAYRDHENPLSLAIARLLLEADSSDVTPQLKSVMEEFYGDGFYGVNYSCISDGAGNRVYSLKTKETDPNGIRLKETIMLLAEYGAAEALEMQGSREERQVPEWARRAFALGADLHKVKASRAGQR